MAKFEQAEITAEYGDRVEGVTFPLKVMFNPTEFTLNKGAQIAEINIPGIDSPILQFVRGQNEKLSLDLFFDTTLRGGTGEGAVDVRTQTEPFYKLVKIQRETHAPPRVRFSWGKAVSFKAIVESVQQKFTLFSSEGVALRATLTVGFREYRTLDEQLKELNLQSPDHTKSRVVKRNESLALIAFQEYGNASLWRAIADDPANRAAVSDPTRLRPGTTLLIPRIDPAVEADRPSA